MLPSSASFFGPRTALFRHPLAPLVLLQLAITAIVAPWGDFPVNDDWAYAHSVLWLLDEHRIRLSDWIAMNLLPQTLMGGAVAALFGFSHAALRALTEVAALATSVLAFQFFRTAGLGARDALFAAALLVVNPWWLSVAHSYMTDIYCLLFSLPAAAAFLRYLQGTQRRRDLAIATVLTVLAVLQRQVALVLPAAFLLAAVFRTRELRPARLVAFAAPLVAAALAEALYQRYLAAGPGLPDAQRALHGRLWSMTMQLVALDAGQWRWFAGNVRDLAGYVALACASWGLWLGIGCENRKRAVGLIVLAALIAAASLAAGWLPPYRPNNLVDAAGLGPFTLGNALSSDAPVPARNNLLFWSAMAAVAAAGLAVLLHAAARAPTALFGPGSRRRRSGTVFLAAVLAGYFLPFAVTDFFDRYVLFGLPFVLAALHRVRGGTPAPAPRALGCAMLAAGALVSALAAHDYFAWNRARWRAVALAERHGATPADIDAGFEYNGFHNHPGWQGGPTPGRRWWWVHDDRYVVDFVPQPGYEVLATLKVSAHLPTTPRRVVLLRREGQ